MQAEDLSRILTCFADSPADIDVKKGELLVQIRDVLIQAKLVRQDGEIFIEEDSQRLRATSWIINRIARLPLLAERILSNVEEQKYFVTPSGHLSDYLSRNPELDEVPCSDAFNALAQTLGQRPVGTSAVLYLTSDAGEGKTTLIDRLARYQANLYKNKKADWLLLPISLGGRAFLRFDDLVVSALVNRFRFQLLYYEGFIELVRLGVLVPAFDGFEEMFVEGSSGEAVSALGNLMNQLNSEGSVLIAARKAYFEYQSFRTQARLFDSVGHVSVTFAKLSISRWSKEQFIEYGLKRGRSDAAEIYEIVRQRFSAEHPLLTRAVLVSRLFEIASSVQEVTEIAKALGTKPQDYFYQFVKAIIEREASQKWLDKQGREGQSLLTVEEHMELLAAIAQEMWISCVDVLRVEVVEVVSDLFSEQKKKTPVFARQIKERIKTHALLRATSSGSIAFDHDDFKQFFIGFALGALLVKAVREDIRAFLKVMALPQEAVEQALQYLKASKTNLNELSGELLGICASEPATSFVIENIGALLIKILDSSGSQNLNIKKLAFPTQSLQGVSLTALRFEECYFFPTSLHGSTITGCIFDRCKFERIELQADSTMKCVFRGCEINALITGMSTPVQD